MPAAAAAAAAASTVIRRDVISLMIRRQQQVRILQDRIADAVVNWNAIRDVQTNLKFLMFPAEIRNKSISQSVADKPMCCRAKPSASFVRLLYGLQFADLFVASATEHACYLPQDDTIDELR
jgi:hypothetical protein